MKLEQTYYGTDHGWPSQKQEAGLIMLEAWAAHLVGPGELLVKPLLHGVRFHFFFDQGRSLYFVILWEWIGYPTISEGEKIMLELLRAIDDERIYRGRPEPLPCA